MCEFLPVIETVFNNWSSLKLCLDHGMGGDPPTVDRKLHNLIDNVHTSLCKGDFYDLVDLLEDTLDADFDTELEDNSAPEVATVLFELHRGWHDGRKEEVLQQIGQMKCTGSILDKTTKRKKDASASQSIPAPSVDEVTTADDVTMQEDAEGGNWTTVSRRK